jgi:hypothetical protein
MKFRTPAAAVLALLASRTAAAELAAARSTDCAHAAATESYRQLSVTEAHQILNRQFSQEGAPPAPLTFDGLDYACVTSYRADALREVAIFGRSGTSDLRLFVNGDADAARLEDAINRLILEARDLATKKTAGATPAPRATP